MSEQRSSRNGWRDPVELVLGRMVRKALEADERDRLERAERRAKMTVVDGGRRDAA